MYVDLSCQDWDCEASPEGVSIDAGQVQAVAPGGTLKLPADRLKGMAQGNQAMTLVVQVKGKKRGELVLPVDASEADIKAAALALPNVQRFVGDVPPRMVKYVAGRLVAIVPGA